MFKKFSLFLLGALLVHPVGAWAELSLTRAVTEALRRDQGIVQFERRSQAARSQAIANGQLPDPVLTLSSQSLPTDTFDLDQEPMTQVGIGFSQQFPAGDTLALRAEITGLSGAAWAQRAGLRRLAVVRSARQHWYELFYWRRAVDIYTIDRSLFQQLLTITQSLFSVGKKQQQDVLRAELEISRLEERLITAREQVRESRFELSRWAGDIALGVLPPTDLPVLPQPRFDSLNPNALAQQLSAHPLVQQLEREVEKSARAIALSEQGYKPQWGVDVNYGYRDGDNPDGSERADFFSVAINIELPFFTGRRQDQRVAAQRSTHVSERARLVDTLREHTARLMAQHARWQQLQSRRQLFERSILGQSASQAQASLNAYRSDSGDFAELMRAYLSEQRTQLEYQRLRVDEQKVLAELHYLAGYEVAEQE